MPLSLFSKATTNVLGDSDWQNVAAGGRDEKELMSSLASLYKEPKFSDVTIVCNSQTFRAHKVILCLRSDYFKERLDAEENAEYLSDKIELSEHPLLVRKMLEYLYTSDYTLHDIRQSFVGASSASMSESAMTESPSEIGNEDAGATSPADVSTPTSSANTLHCNSITFHILMYMLAGRMRMPGLKILAREKFSKKLRVPSVAKCFDLIVSEVYHSSVPDDRTLKQLLLDFTMQHLSSLRAPRAGPEPILTNDMLESFPEFTFDLTLAMLERCTMEQEEKKYQCPNCGTEVEVTP